MCTRSPVLVSIFLIDHAWTYQLEFAHQQLLQIPGLADRMSRLMGLVDGEAEDGEGEDDEEEDVESEEEEVKENGKMSEEETQEDLDRLTGGITRDQCEEEAGTDAVGGKTVVQVRDILRELWR